MKLSSGKRIGQSGGELATAALFSFFLHTLLFVAALFYLQGAPMKHVPLFYEVTLVGPQAGQVEVSQGPSAASQPALPKEKAKAAPKEKKAAPKGKKTAPKPARAKARTSAVPELAKAPQKPAPAEVQEMPAAAAAAPAGGTANEQAGPAPKGEGVAVSTPQQDFKYAWYLAQVRDKISQNWRPPESAQDTKARVIFTLNRSGVVLAVDIDKENSNGNYWFDLAAVRAVKSSRFPPLPEEFSKKTVEFTVDLMAE